MRKEFFRGLPERVVTLFEFIAEEVREWLAELGLNCITDAIGRVDLLERLPGDTQRQQHIDLEPLLAAAGSRSEHPKYCVENNPPYDKGELNQRLMALTQTAIDERQGGNWSMPIRNDDRSVGATLSGYIAKRYGNQGMASHPIQLDFVGTAGQSFGAFNAGGLKLKLTGDANDYVGKGMARWTHCHSTAPRCHVCQSRRHHYGQHLSLRGDRRTTLCRGLCR